MSVSCFKWMILLILCFWILFWFKKEIIKTLFIKNDIKVSNKPLWIIWIFKIWNISEKVAKYSKLLFGFLPIFTNLFELFWSYKTQVIKEQKKTNNKKKWPTQTGPTQPTKARPAEASPPWISLTFFFYQVGFHGPSLYFPFSYSWAEFSVAQLNRTITNLE